MLGNHRRRPAPALAAALVALLALAGCGKAPNAASQSAVAFREAQRTGEAVAAPGVPSPGQPARTLSSDPLDSPAATSVLDARRAAEMAEGMAGMSGMGGHGGGTYRQADAGREPDAHEGAGKQAPGAAQEEAAVYACPMHPEVTSPAPGKCPKCGMTLVERRKG